MLRHPLDDALRTSEEPPRAAFLAGVMRLWPDPFTSQNENVGLIGSSTKRFNSSIRTPMLLSCFWLYACTGSRFLISYSVVLVKSLSPIFKKVLLRFRVSLDDVPHIVEEKRYDHLAINLLQRVVNQLFPLCLNRRNIRVSVVDRLVA